MAEFAKIPQVAAQVNQQRADLERMRVAAEQETARNAAASNSAQPEASGNGSESGDRSSASRGSQAAAQANEPAKALEQERKKQQEMAEAQRKADEQKALEQRRKQEEANRPIEFKEGVVVCQKQKENYYRCEGPLQITYSDLVSANGLTSLRQACGSDSTRDLGSSGGYRLFGCGFGMNPTARDYPGNRDVPAEYGLYVAGRGRFHCPQSTLAYCTKD
jgi:hypothetical protein